MFPSGMLLFKHDVGQVLYGYLNSDINRHQSFHSQYVTKIDHVEVSQSFSSWSNVGRLRLDQHLVKGLTWICKVCCFSDGYWSQVQLVSETLQIDGGLRLDRTQKLDTTHWVRSSLQIWAKNNSPFYLIMCFLKFYRRKELRSGNRGSGRLRWRRYYPR